MDDVPLTTIRDKLLLILKRYGSSIGDKVVKFILQFASNHSPAKFKILPKVHKTPRPIVASTKYITTPASRLILWTIYCLSPLLPSLPSYLKDSTQLINELVDCSKDCYLVTADVTSLYHDQHPDTRLPSLQSYQGLSSPTTSSKLMVFCSIRYGAWLWVLHSPFQQRLSTWRNNYYIPKVLSNNSM